MRILLIHNPKAGDRKHSKKQLMAGLTRCGHQTLYHSIKERDWKKALKNPVDLVIAAGGDGTVRKTAFRDLLARTPVDELDVHEHPRVIFRVGENTWLEAIVRCLVAPREAGRIKTRLIKKLLAALNAAPDKVMFLTGVIR